MKLSFPSAIRLRAGLLAIPALLALLSAHSAVAQISLTVDLTKTPQKLLKAHETLAVKPGPMTLYYPKWIPGEHGPDGPITSLSGLHFKAEGKEVPWKRDLLDPFTFHMDVPAGAGKLEADYDYIEPEGGSATDKLDVLEWNEVVLYPAGTPAEKLMYEAKLILPEGWKFGTSLPVAHAGGNQVEFKPISLDLLVDSPVIAGEFYRSIDLTPPGEPIHHEIDMVADAEADLDMSPDIQKKMTNLVAESGKLFGTRHYRDYHFLFTLSDHVAHFGLEHHESNDSRLPERTLLGPDAGMSLGGLLAHEFVHSWNGKFRRPADLAVPYYQSRCRTICCGAMRG
jgi:predicted metalloprotease with PDZ domain